MWVSNDLQGLAIIALSLFSFLGIAEFWQRKGADPEITRKFVHIAGGIVCLMIPFLIQSVWVVLGFSLAIFIFFYLASRKDSLKSIHGVSRESHGTIYYPLAIFILFFLSQNQPWLYITSLLVLALCDSAASLVGSKYGKYHYTVEDEQKSVEGSLIFLLIAYLVIQIPTLLMTDLHPYVIVLASLLVAILVTGVEAISLKGADNLFIPITVCLILSKITTKPPEEVIYQNISLLSFCLLISLAVWRMPAFNVGAAILLVLFIFGTWSLGSEIWALPILIMSVVYFVLWFHYHDQHQFQLTKVRRMTKALIIPFLILFVANYTDRYDFFYAPFLTANAVLLMAIITNFVRHDAKFNQLNINLRAVILATASWLLVVLPPYIIGYPDTILTLFAILVLITIFAMINIRLPVYTDQKLDRLNNKNFTMPLLAASATVFFEYLERAFHYANN